MNTKDYLIAFDFDGVIWNSINECFYIGYDIFIEMAGEIARERDFVREKFFSGRYLAKTSNDFFTLFHLIKENPHIDFLSVSLEDFLLWREKLRVKGDIFFKRFFAERIKLQEENPDFWISLQGPYPGMIEELWKIKNTFQDIVICSNKDKRSIEMLLGKYGFSCDIYSREYSTYKPEQIKKLCQDRNISYDKIIFIDDMTENLLDLRKIGINVTMTSWGYNSKEDQKKMAHKGIMIIKQGDLCRQLITFASSLREEI